jgi:hypothetical protein
VASFRQEPMQNRHSHEARGGSGVRCQTALCVLVVVSWGC